jgi:hypothetical protein
MRSRVRLQAHHQPHPASPLLPRTRATPDSQPANEWTMLFPSRTLPRALHRCHPVLQSPKMTRELRAVRLCSTLSAVPRSALTWGSAPVRQTVQCAAKARQYLPAHPARVRPRESTPWSPRLSRHRCHRPCPTRSRSTSTTSPTQAPALPLSQHRTSTALSSSRPRFRVPQTWPC